MIEQEGVSQPEVTEEASEVEEVVEAESQTMSLPTSMLRPIGGVLRPLDDEEEVRTATITPVGPTLVPGPPINSRAKPETATLRPVRGTLKPVEKAPVRTLQPQEEEEEGQD